jgi:hypothetical protein
MGYFEVLWDYSRYCIALLNMRVNQIAHLEAVGEAVGALSFGSEPLVFAGDRKAESLGSLANLLQAAPNYGRLANYFGFVALGTAVARVFIAVMDQIAELADIKVDAALEKGELVGFLTVSDQLMIIAFAGRVGDGVDACEQVVHLNEFVLSHHRFVSGFSFGLLSCLRTLARTF